MRLAKWYRMMLLFLIVLILHLFPSCLALREVTAANKSNNQVAQSITTNDWSLGQASTEKVLPNSTTQKSHYTWRVSSYPAAVTKLTVDDAIYKGTKMWSDVALVSFTQMEPDAPSVDIDVSFASDDYDATCKRYFRAEEVAHAVKNGGQFEIHFHGNVQWNTSESSTNNLAAIAAHQIGLILGLNHSSNQDSIMFVGCEKSTILGQNDIQTVQALYGARASLASTSGNYSRCSTATSRHTPGVYSRLCAVVYKEAQCAGDSRSFEKDYAIRRLNDAWKREISSAQVSPGCRLKVCQAESLQGTCETLPGASAGADYAEMPHGFDDTITSLSCLCGTDSGDEIGTTNRRTSWSNGVATNMPDRSGCPIAVTYHMPGGVTRMCAVVYTVRRCNGRRLPLEVGRSSAKLDSDWHHQIASAEVNPYCILKVCKLSHFLGTCTNLNGTDTGHTYNSLPDGYEFKIASLFCSCVGNDVGGNYTTPGYQSPNSCPSTFSRFMPHGIRPLCATIYKGYNCNATLGRLFIEAGNRSSSLTYGWRNTISSIQISPHCTFKACYYPWFKRCVDWDGESDGRAYDTLPTLDDNIMSFMCTCTGILEPLTMMTKTESMGAISERSTRTAPQSSHLFIGQPPPAIIPRTNHRTCAVFSSGLLQQVAKLSWMKQEIMNNVPASLAQESLIYGVTAAGCSIYHCPRPAFGGTCKSLGPGQHTNISNAQRFSIRSYICDCQYGW